MPTTRYRDRRGYVAPTRRGKIHIGASFDPAVHDAMHEVMRRAKISKNKDLVAEAIRDVLIKYGVTPPDDLSAG